MSEKEADFIKQLRKVLVTLALILVPFMITSIGSMINDHYKIKSNHEAVKAIRGNYVSNDLLLLYVNEFRKANDLLRMDVINNKSENTQKIADIHKEMDELMKEIYKNTKREVPKL